MPLAAPVYPWGPLLHPGAPGARPHHLKAPFARSAVKLSANQDDVMALCLSLYAAMQCEEALSADSGSQHGADVHVWFGRLDGLIEAAERVLDTLAHSFSSGRPEAMRNTGRAVLALARELSRIEEGLSGVDCRAVEPARKAVHILMGHFVLFGLKRAPTQLVGDVARSSLEEARTQLQDDRLAVAQESVHGGTSPPRWSGRRLAPVVPRQTRQA